MKRILFCVLIGVFALLGVSAQPVIKKVQVALIPNHADALYKVGEQAKFKVVAMDCGIALNDVTIDYEVSEDLLPAHLKKSITLNFACSPTLYKASA